MRAPTTRNIVEGVLDATRPGWRERRAKRKSWWDLANGYLAIVLMLPSGVGLAYLAWHMHTLIYPAHAGHFRQFWQAGLSVRALISSVLLVVPLTVPAFVLGALVANGIMWCIPTARRTMEAEAAGDPEMSFDAANRGLMTWGGRASAIAIGLSLLGAATLVSLR